MSNPDGRRAFERGLSDGTFFEVGRFENEHGERFVVFTTTDPSKPSRRPPTYYVTGDEVDWETTFEYVNGVLAYIVLLAPKEIAEIEKIVR